MIVYARGGKWHIINLFFMTGSLFPKSFIVAAPCAIITGLLKYYEVINEKVVLLDNSAWNGFSFLVGFLVVFRTSEAYSRFWAGCTATHQMRAEWMDAATALISFCKHTDPERQEEVQRFKHLVVRMFSILHAMAWSEIEECEDIEEVMAFDLELIDPTGIDKETWKSLVQCKNKVTLVFVWIQSVIVENIYAGLLTIPPPIASRVFQELANGMVCLNEAQKIATVPFPFPYAQTCDALLIMHWVITPFITAQYTAHWSWGAVFSFIQVFILWSLNNIAVEIEHPFGGDANDLEAHDMQTDMNMNLLLLLHPCADRLPQLSRHAKLDSLVCKGRAASVSIKTAQTFKQMAMEANRESRKGGDNYFWEHSYSIGAEGCESVNSFGEEDEPFLAGDDHSSSGALHTDAGRGAPVEPQPSQPDPKTDLQAIDASRRMDPGCSPPPLAHSGDQPFNSARGRSEDPRVEPSPRELSGSARSSGHHGNGQEGPRSSTGRDLVEEARHWSVPPADASEQLQRPHGTGVRPSGVGQRMRQAPVKTKPVQFNSPDPSSSSREAPRQDSSTPRSQALELPPHHPPAESLWRQGAPASPSRQVIGRTDVDLEAGNGLAAKDLVDMARRGLTRDQI